MLKSFKSLADFNKAFPDENACINHFRAVRWPDATKIPCPHCGAIGAHYTLANNTHKCRDCRRKFTVRADTIFGDSKIDLRRWFMAIFLMTSHKKGISSCQLAKDIGVTQKTAWFMLHRRLITGRSLGSTKDEGRTRRPSDTNNSKGFGGLSSPIRSPAFPFEKGSQARRAGIGPNDMACGLYRKDRFWINT